MGALQKNSASKRLGSFLEVSNDQSCCRDDDQDDCQDNNRRNVSSVLRAIGYDRAEHTQLPTNRPYVSLERNTVPPTSLDLNPTRTPDRNPDHIGPLHMRLLAVGK